MSSGRLQQTCRRGALTAALGLMLLAGWVPAVPAVGPTTERVSLAQDGSQANGGSSSPAISADGRTIAFTSSASNLVGFDTNLAGDVFVRDRVAGTTERVSVPQGGGQADSNSSGPAISADGRYVAFHSQASNLGGPDIREVLDLFVRDRVAGTTERVSVAVDGGPGNHNSTNPVISADGRYVAFESLASNLVSGDTNGRFDIFVRDRTAGTTQRVSVSQCGAEASDSSFHPAISADGRYVAFESSASNLIGSDTNLLPDVFLRDRMAGTTERVSVSQGGVQANSASASPSISADGRYVAFISGATNLVSGDTNGLSDVFVRDRVTGMNERVSLAADGSQGNNTSFDPVISADGRYVAFFSSATNLVSGDTNGALDIFVRDRLAGTTERVSLTAEGGQGSGGPSTVPAISADGRAIAFQSFASDLVPIDTNAAIDVFVRDRATSEGLPQLSVSDPSVSEGASGQQRSLVFTVSLSAVSTEDVLFRFWTEDNTARAGADYVDRFGTGFIPAGALSTTVSVSDFGDGLREPNETFHLNIDVPSNATIADGGGVGTIVNDDGLVLLVGLLDLEPPNAVAAVGERLRYALTWTVPSQSWHDLRSIELRIGDDGSVLWLRFDEATGRLTLARGLRGPAFPLGRPNRLETSLATVHLAGSSLLGTGTSVTLFFELSFKPPAAGRSYPVEVRAINDAGEVEGFDHAATVTVQPRGQGRFAF